VDIGGRRAPPALGLYFALAAVVGLSAASAPPIAAEPQTTITFGSGGSTGIEVSSEDQANQITVNFAPSTGPLPEKFVIQVPAGYGLDLTAEPGTAVRDGSLSVLGTELPSFASGYGDFVAQDPAAYASDPAAQACAPGLHGAVWALSTALVAGRRT
jgi:hypothetical protein